MRLSELSPMNIPNTLQARIALVALVFLSFASSAPAQTAKTDGDWKPLFNGKDFSGWYTWLKGAGKDSDPTRIFQIHDGIIHIYKDAPHASTQPFGYVC